MDTAGVEQVTLNALGGVDQVIVNDLYVTEVVNVGIDLGIAGAGDAATDFVTVNGRDVADNLLISAVGATGVP